MSENGLQNVMVVTGDPDLTQCVLGALAAKGARGVLAPSVRVAGQKLPAGDWAMILADLDTLDTAAEQFVHEARLAAPEAPVVLAGTRSSPSRAVRLAHSGCTEYVKKPLEAQQLHELLDTLLPSHEVPLAGGDTSDLGLYRMAGRSDELLGTLGMAEKLAPTSVPVLLTGESGTGKELLACFIHRRSNRAQRPYVRVNCAALCESVLESELFGHEKGAFTGAHARYQGRFERANGGTLLLDEISETGPRFQAELLRVLEQQELERLGGGQAVPINVRVISTSNKDLPREVARGRFRADLYYRIAATQLELPPLRRRREDIGPLVWHFVNTHAGEVRRRITSLCPDMLKVFSRYDWPGNIRELRNVVRNALIFGEGPVLALPEQQLEKLTSAPRRKADAPDLLLHEVERKAIFEALKRTGSHQAKAATLLGISDRTLREKLRRYRRDQKTPQQADPQEITC